MIAKLKAAFAALRAGQELADPAIWKNRQAAGGALAAFLGACVLLGKSFGVEVPVTDTQLLLIGTAIATVWGIIDGYLTLATSTKVGLRPGAADDGLRDDDYGAPGALPPERGSGVDDGAGKVRGLRPRK